MACSYQGYAIACVSALLDELRGYCLSDPESKKIISLTHELYLIAKKHRDGIADYNRRHPAVVVVDSDEDDLPF